MPWLSPKTCFCATSAAIPVFSSQNTQGRQHCPLFLNTPWTLTFWGREYAAQQGLLNEISIHPSSMTRLRQVCKHVQKPVICWIKTATSCNVKTRWWRQSKVASEVPSVTVNSGIPASEVAPCPLLPCYVRCKGLLICWRDFFKLNNLAGLKDKFYQLSVSTIQIT